MASLVPTLLQMSGFRLLACGVTKRHDNWGDIYMRGHQLDCLALVRQRADFCDQVATLLK